MVLNKFPLSDSSRVNPKGLYQLVVAPGHLDELFRIAVVSKHAQRLLQMRAISPYVLKLPAKILVYEHHVLVRDEHVLVRLPQTKEELEYLDSMKTPELWEIDEAKLDKVATITGATLNLDGGSPIERQQFMDLWTKSDRDLPLFTRLTGIVQESFAGVFSKNKQNRGVQYPFPLFRADFLSVYNGSIKECLAMVLERLRQRYEVKRDLARLPATLVVTPNLDHLRFLFEQQHRELQGVYRKAFLQTADGHPPLIAYGKASLGYQPHEQVTGVDLFMQLINIIGSEALPYTIYLVGGFGNVPYKTRDYFTSVYPHLKDNFVGISTPPMGFLEDKSVMDAIATDIDAKKPDIIFAGMTVPTQERFVFELMERKVNFGIGFCIGRAIEMVSGYQKKEPALVERLHLSWIYRMIFGGKKDIKKRQRNRVIKDFQFVFRTLFSK